MKEVRYTAMNKILAEHFNMFVDIVDTSDLIKTIKADSHEAAPEHDTPDNIPF